MALWSKQILFLFLFFIFIFVNSSDIHYRLESKKFFCTATERQFLNVTCKLNQLNRTHQTFTMFAEQKSNMSIDALWVRVSILYRGKNDLKFHPYIGVSNMTVNMCKYMNGEENNSIIDMMIHNLKKYGNLIQPCPIKGSVYAKDIFIDDSKLLQIVPIGEYLVHIIFSTRISVPERFLADLKLLMEIKPKRLRK